MPTVNNKKMLIVYSKNEDSGDILLICLPSISLGLKVHLKRNELTNQVIFYQIMFIIWKCNIHYIVIVFRLAQFGVTSTKFRVFTLDLA